MRILDRYISREIFSHTLLGLAVFTFVFFVPQLVRLMDLVVRHSGAENLALLFVCSLVPVLAFTLPMAVLVGVLIGLGRLSADSEIIALHALGISLRRLLFPVGGVAGLATVLTLFITLWLGPASLRTLHSLEQDIASRQAPFAVQPRVFDERFPRLILYVEDVDAAAARWRGVFLAESDGATGSHMTLAESAIVVAEPEQGKFELHMGRGTSHEYDPRFSDRYNVSTFGSTDLPIEITAPSGQQAASLSDAERPTWDLLHAAWSGNWRFARVELHRRLAFPVACLVFALLGVPVGVRPRRGGRAAGLILTLLLISGYYLVFVAGAHWAQQGLLSPFEGIWCANLFTALAAVSLLPGIEQISGERRLRQFWDRLQMRWRRAARLSAPRMVRTASAKVIQLSGSSETAVVRQRAAGFPLLIDIYILRVFLYYFAVLLAGFIVLFDAFTLFDLLGDISRHHIAVSLVVNYFLYLLPYLTYQLLPLGALVATLVTLGVLAKNNEVTAFKASGVSMYRLCLPLIFCGLALAAAMFLLDETFLPYANQRQDALRNQIKGRPAQTFFQPTHQWILGEGGKVFNYDLFDPYRGLFGGLNVFELHPKTFQMRRRVYAARASWSPSLGTWVLESGWVRDFEGDRVTRYLPFTVYSLQELSEPPSYFQREVKQYYQMNWRQLRDYIRGLSNAGFDTSRLSVQWHEKFAFPLIAAIIVFLCAPFAFLVGTRGAVGGLAAAVGIGIVYWSVSKLFEAMGGVGQLPPLLAGWTPDAIFAFLGVYFFLKMPT